MKPVRPVRWLTPQEVGNMCGFSDDFIRLEIHTGNLKARYIVPASRKRGRYLIAYKDALKYYQRLHNTSYTS